MKRLLLTLLSTVLLIDASLTFAATGNTDTVAAYPRVVVYSTPWCVSCNAAKDYLKKNNIPFIGKDVDANPRFMEELSDRYRISAVLVIIIGKDQKVLRGFVPEVFSKAFKEVWASK
jgi:glutaredoxin-like protein NrdH